MSKKCKKCGHRQNLKADRENQISWACSSCGFRNKLKILAAIAVLLFIAPFASAYATEDTVNLPFDKSWDAKGASIIFYHNTTDVKVIFWYDYSFALEFIEQMPKPEDSPSDYEHMKAVEIWQKNYTDTKISISIEEPDISSTDDRERTKDIPRRILLEDAAVDPEKFCSGLEENQQVIQYPDENVTIAYEFEGDIRKDIAALTPAKISEFCIAYKTARDQGFDFLNNTKEDPIANEGLDPSQLYREQRTASEDKMAAAVQKALDTIAKSSHLASMNQSGFEYQVDPHQFPEERTFCMPKPSNPQEEMCPAQDVTDYLTTHVVHPEVARIASLNAALVEACSLAWERTDHGAKTLKWWDDMLTDGTCNKHIPGLMMTLARLQFEESRALP